MSNGQETAVNAAIVIETAEREHVGFMLVNLTSRSNPTTLAGECIFMLLPNRAELVVTPLGRIISELKVAGEHSCNLDQSESLDVFIASPNTLPKIKVSIPKVGLGKLEEKLGSGWMERGIAFYAKR